MKGEAGASTDEDNFNMYSISPLEGALEKKTVSPAVVQRRYNRSGSYRGMGNSNSAH